MKYLLSLIAILCLPLSGAAAAPGYGVVGFANYHDLGLQGVTGGMDGETVHVSTYADLVKHCSSSQPLTIIIDKTIEGGGINDVTDNVKVTSNKTIIGRPGVVLDGICLDANSQQNIIIRNVKLTRGKPDGFAFRTCHHVWIDHCDLSTCDDGLLDYTIGSSYMTVSYSAFHDHDKVSLSCSGTMHYEDIDKNRVTYHHNHYYNGTQRNPRIGYGLGHLWNNYWNHNTYNGSAGYCVGYFNGARVLVENSYFTDVKNPFHNMYGVYEYDSAWAQLEARNNLFGSGVSGDRIGTGKSFDVSPYYDYEFSLQDPSVIEKGDILAEVGPQDWVLTDIYGFPGNGAKYLSNLKELKWSRPEGAVAFKVCLSTSPDALTEVYSGTDNKYALSDLEPGATYFWQVSATFADASVVESAVWRFTVAAAAPVLPVPADGAADYKVYQAFPHGVTMEGKGCVATEPGLLEWKRAADAVSYKVYLGKEGEELELIGETDGCSIMPTAHLTMGQKYSWQVEAVTSTGEIVPSDVWTFSSEYHPVEPGRTEAEHMIFYGQTFLELENGMVNWCYKASNDYVTAGEAGTGTLGGTYVGKDAVCDVTVCYFDEKQGQGKFQLRVNGEVAGSFTGNKNTNKLATATLSDIELHPGDQLALDFLMQDKMKCRIDYMDIAVVREISGIEAVEPDADADAPRYNIFGQRVGPDYKGIVICNGKKYVVR